MEVIETHKPLVKEDNQFMLFARSLIYSRKARRFARKTKRAIKTVMQGFGQEAIETKEMAFLFFRMLENKLDLQKRSIPPTAEEVKEAIEQLKDIGRISVFASISLLPGGGFSLIGLELLARKFGIRKFTFVPSAFRKKNRKFRARSFGRAERQLPQPKLSQDQETQV